jgi:hypothetical protein
LESGEDNIEIDHRETDFENGGLMKIAKDPFKWFFLTPSIATKFQYVNSLLFSFSLTTCFGPYGPSSSEIYN